MNGFGVDTTLVVRSKMLKFVDSEITEELAENLKKLNVNLL